MFWKPKSNFYSLPPLSTRRSQVWEWFSYASGLHLTRSNDRPSALFLRGSCVLIMLMRPFPPFPQDDPNMRTLFRMQTLFVNKHQWHTISIVFAGQLCTNYANETRSANIDSAGFNLTPLFSIRWDRRTKKSKAKNPKKQTKNENRPPNRLGRN